MHLDIPWLIEEFEFASPQTFCEPALCGVVEDGETVEEGDPVLGERVKVLCECIVNAGLDDVDGDEDNGGDEDDKQHVG